MAENSLPLEPKSVARRTRRFRWSVGVLMALLITAGGISTWYNLRNSCEVNAVQEASTLLVIQTKHFDDVYQVATNAFQTTLEAPVLTLQQIIMDTQEIPVPACLQTAKDELITYMKIVVRAFRAYAAQEANTMVRDLIAQSNQHYGNFFTELKAVNKCAPLCLP